MWRNLKFLHIWYVYDVKNVLIYVNVMLFCWKIGFTRFCHEISFVAIDTLLGGEKIELKIAYVEKKWQISGMLPTNPISVTCPLPAPGQPKYPPLIVLKQVCHSLGRVDKSRSNENFANWESGNVLSPLGIGATNGRNLNFSKRGFPKM